MSDPAAYFRRDLLFLFFVAGWLFLLAACGSSDSPLERRAQLARQEKGPISIGIVSSSITPDLFAEGASLAISEINAEGGVSGRPLAALFYDDEGNVEKGKQIARELSENMEVAAVIGHRYSSVAIPASIIYEKNGMLFISHGATDQDLIRDMTVLTFRNIPSDEATGEAAARYVKEKGFADMAVVFDSESSGRRVAEIFRERVEKLGVRISAEVSYSGFQRDFRLMIADLMKDAQFDALFLGGVLPSAAVVIRQLRDMGLDIPIIGNDLLDSPELMNIAGKAAEGVVIPTVFDPGKTDSRILRFVKSFESEMGMTPDTWAAQGYDAVQLLAHAMERSGSTAPLEIAATLRFMGEWKGVTGAYAMSQTGGVTDKSIYFKVVRDGDFRYPDRGLDEDVNIFEEVEAITLRLPVEGAVTTIDPGLTFDTISIELTEQLFLGLTDFNPKTYEPVPELAKSWTVGEDGTQYTFHLREDAFWTDQTPVTAHDLVWAIQRNLRPETDCPYAYMLYILKNARGVHSGEIKDMSRLGVRAADAYTVVFDLESPAAFFPSMAGLWVYRPLPRRIIETFGDAWTWPDYIQTNGSYKLAAWEKGLALVLRKNETYFDADNVAISEVRYYIIPESSVGLTMYKNRQLDILGDAYLRIPLDALPTIARSPIYAGEYFREPIFCTYAYAFNTSRPPVDNPLVRKAISAAIDRELLIKLVAGGEQQAATTFTRPPIFGAVEPESGIGVSYDPEKAKKWLTEAGYPDGRGFPGITLQFNESETHWKIAKAVQTLLKHHLNIDLKLEALEWEAYLDARSKKLEAEMIRFNWCADYPDANNWLNELFHPDKSDNIIEWDNEEFGMLMDMAQRETDPEDRKVLYARAEQILCEVFCAVVPIYFETAHYLVNPRVKGWYGMAMGGQHIRNWRLED